DSNPEEFLQELYEGGVLTRNLHDKLIHCPSCNSTKVTIHYTCPHCKSFDIKKSALIEHIKCGYIDTEDKFQKNSKLVCPKCKTELINSGMDYHKAGVWCNCNTCTKSFDIPVPEHFCRDCQAKFGFDDSIYSDVYSYGLTPEAEQEADLDSIITVPITELFEGMGFKVESSGVLTGKSGTNHKFDITAVNKKTKKVTAIDVATADDTVSEQSVISMFAKIFDVSPDCACLVALPKMSESGKNLAKLYKITLIEAKDQATAIDALRLMCASKSD
ncbi:MAG: hypothetical protein CW691_07535, partial [Candidatus Bathyarchaeum sp.]